MAIAIDAVNTKVNGNVGGTITFAHTCTGSDLILWVAISCNDSNQTANQTSGVTYAGAAMTKLVEADSLADTRTEYWYKVNPATGNNNVVVTISSVVNAVMITSLSFTGVKQSTPTLSYNTTGTAGSVSNGIATSDDNSWILDSISCELSPSVSNTGSPTQTSRSALTNQSFQWGSTSSKGPDTPAGTYTLGWTNISGNTWSYIQVVFSPVAVVSTTSQIFGLSQPNTNISVKNNNIIY